MGEWDVQAASTAVATARESSWHVEVLDEQNRPLHEFQVEYLDESAWADIDQVVVALALRSLTRVSDWTVTGTTFSTSIAPF